MDSDRELNEIVNNEFSLEIELAKNAFDQHTWSSTTTKTNIGQILKAINSHFERYKSQGCMSPLLVFDWIHIGSLSKGVDRIQFHKDKAEEFYGEPYDEAKHNNWLPETFQKMVN